MRTEEEVKEVRDSIFENDLSKYPSMTYEQGFTTALDWVAGHIETEEL